MPGWTLHANVANDIMKRENVKNQKAFFLGAVLPDCPWLELKDAIMSGMRERMHLYRARNGLFGAEPDISQWCAKYGRALQYNDLFKGMLSHIILDNEINLLWNVAAEVDAFDRIILADGSYVTQDKAAKTKWNELDRYREIRYGRFNPLIGADGSYDEVIDYLIDILCLNEDEIKRSISTMEKVIEKDLNKSIDCKSLTVKTSVYDSAISVAIAKYFYLMDTLFSF